MIRDFSIDDLESITELASTLPENCMPPVVIEVDGEKSIDPLFLANVVMEQDGAPVMASFLKGTAELYLLVDHDKGTPEQRWQWLKELKLHMEQRAFRLGLNEMSAWIPPEIEKSFGPRLDELGFIKSPWSCYTLPIT